MDGVPGSGVAHPMRRPQSQPHALVLWTCVFGCLWVALSDERIGPEVLSVEPEPILQVAVEEEGPEAPTTETPEVLPVSLPPGLRRFLDLTPGTSTPTGPALGPTLGPIATKH